MARTKAAARRPLPSKEFLPPRMALHESAGAPFPTSSAATPASRLTQDPASTFNASAPAAAQEPAPTFNAPAPAAAQEPAPAVNAPAPAAAQDPPPPFDAEEMRSFLAEMDTMNNSGAAPMTASRAQDFTRQFQRFTRTITLASNNMMTQALQADTHAAAGGSPLITYAERQELRQKLIAAKQKIKNAMQFHETASEALRSHKTVVREAEALLNERHELLLEAEGDYKVKRARLDVLQAELDMANGDLQDAEETYKATKNQ
jgi:hypothetical protein